MFCAVLKWVGAESARDSHLAELLGLIRFPTMTLDQLTAVGKEPRVVACPGFKVSTHVVITSIACDWCLHEAMRSLPWPPCGDLLPHAHHNPGPADSYWQGGACERPAPASWEHAESSWLACS